MATKMTKKGLLQFIEQYNQSSGNTKLPSSSGDHKKNKQKTPVSIIEVSGHTESGLAARKRTISNTEKNQEKKKKLLLLLQCKVHLNILHQ